MDARTRLLLQVSRPRPLHRTSQCLCGRSWPMCCSELACRKPTRSQRSSAAAAADWSAPHRRHTRRTLLRTDSESARVDPECVLESHGPTTSLRHPRKSELSRHANTGQLLDIGCNTGYLLEAAARAGYDPTGQPAASKPARDGRARGRHILSCELADAGFDPDTFDVITANHLLEHLRDPRSVISEVARILKPAGIFYVTVPHLHGLRPRLLGAPGGRACILVSIFGISPRRPSTP